MRILIVDDNSTNLKLLRAQLEAEGYQVAAAQNGVEALAVLEREKVGAIVSDILMPQMDGYRLCYEVRKNKRLQAIPFIFYTAAYTSPSDEKLCFDLGGDKYLRKPSTVAEISSALRDARKSAAGRPPNRAGTLSESEVMKEYSERLVSKLEEKNIELQQALEKLRRAHNEITCLNRSLEQRIEQRTAELEAANKELEAFCHSISHDLRAPLRAMGGFARILEQQFEATLPSKAKHTIERICANAAQMGRLIDGLLDFSSLNWMPVTKKNITPAAIAHEVVEELRPDTNGRRVKIEIADLPRCKADPTLLKQVYVNLLSNALKYSRNRDPAIIKVGWLNDTGGPVYFVQDNGAGFEMEYAHKLFGVFQRLHGSDEFEGVGVGLSIVQRIIQRHGGRVWAEAKIDNGATFYFTVGQTSQTPAQP